MYHKRHDLLTLRKHRRSPRFGGTHVVRLFSFCAVLCSFFVVVLFIFVLCTQCSQCLWIVRSWFPPCTICKAKPLHCMVYWLLDANTCIVKHRQKEYWRESEKCHLMSSCPLYTGLRYMDYSINRESKTTLYTKWFVIFMYALSKVWMYLFSDMIIWSCVTMMDHLFPTNTKRQQL